MKINIGAGHNKVDGFVSVDNDSSLEPDILTDIELEQWPFDDNSVTHVLAHHILEHLGVGYFHAIKELYRVCKHGAIIDVRVPHPRHDSYIADPTHVRPITPLGLQMFSTKFNDYCIKIQASSSLLAYKHGVNFDILEWNYVPVDKYREFFSDKPKEFIDEYISERNNVIAEYHIKLVAIKE